MKFRIWAFLAVFATGSALAAERHDHPSTHGMLIFGDKTVFVSHLPLFHNPHDYQVVSEVTLDAAGLKVYQADRRANPAQPVYTIAPERFVLPEMIAKPRPFRAELFRGHFERGGERIATIQVTFKNVTLFTQLKASGPRSQGVYQLIGSSAEAYLVHIVSAAPDFDQIIQVKAPAALAERLAQQKSILLNVEAVDTLKPIDPTSVVNAKVLGEPEPTVKLEGFRPVYLEFDDLAN